MSTNVLKASHIKRSWHLVDVKGKVLGRIATEIAKKLSGKDKVNYVPYLDLGDFVVVINASGVKLTGKKAEQKNYMRHSGYPGGLTVESFSRLIVRRPDEVIRHAVKGMIPKNKLGSSMLKRLHVFASSAHPFAKQLGLTPETKNEENTLTVR